MKPRKEQTLWITASVVLKTTGLTTDELKGLRKHNPIDTGFYKIAETGGYLYNAKMIEPLKKVAA